MKNFFYLTMIGLLVFSCNNQSGNNSTEETKKQIEEAVEVSLAQLAEFPKSYEGKIMVKGMVTHVCKHGGQKMFLTNESQDANMLIRVSSSIPEFEVALEGSTVEITGKLIATLNTPDKGAGHSEGEEEADCAAEENINAKSKDNKNGEEMSYHIEALSFEEIN